MERQLQDSSRVPVAHIQSRATSAHTGVPNGCSTDFIFVECPEQHTCYNVTGTNIGSHECNNSALFTVPPWNLASSTDTEANT